MSQYTKSTNFATKDNLTPGDPLKVVRGTEIDTEYNNIATAIATKTDNASAAITGGTITGITDLAVADGGTGASTAAGALNNLLPSQTSAANKYLQSDGTNASWDAVTLSTADITGTLPVANGGTGVTASTGTGNVVLSNSPTLVTPALGTPASGTATNLTGLPISTGVSGLGTGVATFLGTPSSANLASAVTDETGSGALVFANSPTLVTPALGTPSALVGTNITGTASGLTAGNVTTNANLTGAVTSVGNATSLGSFSSANLLGALTDETGTGSAVFATSPTLVTPILGTPTSATLTNATGLPIATGVSGLGTGVATFLATPSSANLAAALTDETGTGSAVFATSPTLVTPVLGVATGTSFQGIIGNVTPAAGTFTTVTASGNISGDNAILGGDARLPLTGKLSFNGATASDYMVGPTNGAIDSYIGSSQVMRLTSTGLGIGTSSPSGKLHLVTTGPIISTFESSAANGGYQTFSNSSTVPLYIGFGPTLVTGISTSDAAFRYSNNLVFSSGATEKMRIDSSGNVLIGTTANANSARLKSKVSGGSVGLEITDEASSDFVVVPASSSGVCKIGPTAGAMSFQSAGTERARITSGGDFYIGATVNVFSTTTTGINLFQNGNANYSTNGANVLYLNRNTDDGDLVLFYQALTQEGSISVSGTTVSYNGGHLSRYAQTTTAKDESIVKGTVLSNLDEMSVYTKDGQPVANEQLNKVKVSDTEGDVNVAGVFVNWSHDKDHNVDEINMAMTGDMIIRIAQGTTVVRGDLLMSAGDGTAKPQGDDIVRSKTVAKVTSNHVTCTYADGSYCVPCVLMAC